MKFLMSNYSNKKYERFLKLYSKMKIYITTFTLARKKIFTITAGLDTKYFRL